MLRLEGDVVISFNDKRITNNNLADFERKNRKLALLPGIGRNDVPLGKSFLPVLNDLNLVLISKERVTLGCYFYRFPYCIGNKEDFSNFGIKFVPKTGSISKVILGGACDEEMIVHGQGSRPTVFRSHDVCLVIFTEPTEVSPADLPMPYGFRYYRYGSGGEKRKDEPKKIKFEFLF